MSREIPSATYRLQLSRRFDLDEARRVLPYLDRLGVDTVYLSPVFSARPGSSHGYDGVDPSRIDADRGGPSAFRRLCRALERRRMGLLLDIVPNHLAASLENPAWVDVLRRGPRSRYSGLFDIDWSRSSSVPVVVLPWLDRDAASAFAAGTLRWEWRRRTLSLRWNGATLPGSIAASRRFRAWVRVSGPIERRGVARSAASRAGALLQRLNEGRTPGAKAQRDRLLEDLHYRLIPWWRVEEINYRRFFDIAGLVGVRSGEPLGFEFMHRGLRWVQTVAPSRFGVRVDHVDGLADPRAYLEQLAAALRKGAARQRRRSPYLIVERILAWD
ncbi:MAG: alpha-amylase family glycosyl hydrolase, partial [Thermoplasmata archaeon]